MDLISIIWGLLVEGIGVIDGLWRPEVGVVFLLLTVNWEEKVMSRMQRRSYIQMTTNANR